MTSLPRSPRDRLRNAGLLVDGTLSVYDADATAAAGAVFRARGGRGRHSRPVAARSPSTMMSTMAAATAMR